MGAIVLGVSVIEKVEKALAGGDYRLNAIDP